MTDTPDPDIAALIARAEAHKLTMRPLLIAEGVSPSTWWRWKVGKCRPLHDTLRRVAAAVDREISAIAA